ncbi:chemotaxis protein CheW [bacterium]|nr:chemotaxis protein CheW [bacterium]
MTPVQLLRDMAQRCRVQAATLPEGTDPEAAWSGIGFHLGEQALVVAMAEVSEILQAPRVTRLPHVQPWVLGVANVRGRLIPLLDLNRFFGLPDHRNRRPGLPVLVIEQGEQTDGLLVDSVDGMQHFADTDFSAEPPAVNAGLKPYIRGQYRRDRRSWALISLTDLFADPRFQQVALA